MESSSHNEMTNSPSYQQLMKPVGTKISRSLLLCGQQAETNPRNELVIFRICYYIYEKLLVHARCYTRKSD
jgi:hypothetical protein